MVTILLEDGTSKRFDSYQPLGNGLIRCRRSDQKPPEMTEYYHEGEIARIEI